MLASDLVIASRTEVDIANRGIKLIISPEYPINMNYVIALI